MIIINYNLLIINFVIIKIYYLLNLSNNLV